MSKNVRSFCSFDNALKAFVANLGPVSAPLQMMGWHRQMLTKWDHSSDSSDKGSNQLVSINSRMSKAVSIPI